MGKGNVGHEACIGRHGFGERNEQGDMITSFATAGGLAIIDTFFKKQTSQVVATTRKLTVLCRRTGLKQVVDCKVIPGECVAKQHKPIVCKAKLKGQQHVRRRIEKQTRWWKLEDQTLREDFVEKVKGRTPDGNNSWDMISKIIKEVAKETLGETSGKAKENREMCDGGIKKSKRRLPARRKRRKGEILIDQKRLSEYKEACKIAKQEVAKAKSRVYKDLYDSLDSSDGLWKAMRMAKIKNRNLADVLQAKLIKDRRYDISRW